MAPKNPKDKEQIGRVGEAGLFLVSDRTLSWEWDSLPRRDPKAAWERLGPIRSSKTRAKRWPEARNRMFRLAALTQCRRPHTLPSGVN